LKQKSFGNLIILNPSEWVIIESVKYSEKLIIWLLPMESESDNRPHRRALESKIPKKINQRARDDSLYK
jgi:hypothetical protein